jgi:hypothetical protein
VCCSSVWSCARSPLHTYHVGGRISVCGVLMC